MWYHGTFAIRQSLEFMPLLNQTVVDTVLNEIVPIAVVPREDDTKESLAQRIADAHFSLLWVEAVVVQSGFV